MEPCKNENPPIDPWQTAIDYGIDVSLLEYNMSLTPEQRILNHEMARAYIKEMNSPKCEYYGFDARRPDWIVYCSISRKKQEIHVPNPGEIAQ